MFGVPAMATLLLDRTSLPFGSVSTRDGTAGVRLEACDMRRLARQRPGAVAVADLAPTTPSETPSGTV